MLRNYKIDQHCIAYTLLVSLLLQSCTNFSNSLSLIPIEQNQVQTIQSKNITKITNELIAQGGHRVTGYEQNDQLQADVKVNAPVGFSKSYSGLSVYVGVATNPTEIAQLEKKMQTRFVDVKLPISSHTGYVHIGKRGLMEGMKERRGYNSIQQESFCNLVSIGEGSFGVVHKGIWKKSLAQSISIAIKTLKHLHRIEELSKEAAIMKNMIQRRYYS